MDFRNPHPSDPQLLYARADVHGTGDSRPPVYKAIGISLAIASGLFIGTSFVLKKTGLLRANIKYNEEAGEGYGYLKNAFWWSGMTLMIIGEICNFVAYAFVDAILVTPLGALSVVITTILSAIFLKERLSFVGKVGCFCCIIGSVVIVMNAPAQASAANIQEMKHFVIAPGFLSYAGLVIVASTFVALWVGPRYGKKSMLVYLTICSLIGGLSVVSTQGLGAAIVAQAAGKPQFNQWFLYVLLVFVITTLVTEIIYLNVSTKGENALMMKLTLEQKALNLFNAAVVTPTYYVYFTSATIVTSAILFQGFKGSPTSIITVVMGFFVICSGVVLLQLSKSAKDVPDTAVLKGDIDQIRTVAEQAEPESEPKADAIRGAAAIIRRFSQSRQKMEAAEAKRVHEDRMRDQMEPIGENETVEWDGLRRRKTVVEGPGSLRRQKTIHPPLGMTHFPDDDSNDDPESRPSSTDVHGGGVFHGGIFDSFRRHKNPRKDSLPAHTRTVHSTQTSSQKRSSLPQRPLTEIVVSPKMEDTAYHPQGTDNMEMTGHVYGLPGTLRHVDDTPNVSPGTAARNNRPIQWAEQSKPISSSASTLAPVPPPHQAAKRQFSFQNVFHRNRGPSTDGADEVTTTVSPPRSPPSTSHSHMSFNFGNRLRSPTVGSGGSTKYPVKTVTEEEQMGLVKGDSNILGEEERTRGSYRDGYEDEGEDSDLGAGGAGGGVGVGRGRIAEETETEDSESSEGKEEEARAGGYRREYDYAYRGREDGDDKGGGSGGAGGGGGSGRPAFI
ncbi:uncharacterized protein KY384_002366 [Bacidia gigantensis]|uniref:uncharacterized protein n=1 Tax=Bacidia gigantensis TaxID=2732470 RepID=UPI001D04EDD9|nr:uncharacterized protein KY384_002366 [Bacidia gigantensis]KAG8532489.1 hypothetical protein KY384_002366 [Bacidia gigantensis]